MEVERGYRRYRGERERVLCVRHFHGNLSGVCLVSGDDEEQRGGEGERDEKPGENYPSLRVRGGWEREIMEGRGDSAIAPPPTLLPSLLPPPPPVVCFSPSPC